MDGAADAGEPAAGFAEDDMVVDFCSDFGSIDLNNLLDGTQTGGGMFAKVDNTDPGTLIGNTFNAGNLPGSDPVTIQFTYTVMGGGACTAGTDQTTFALTVQPAPDAGSLDPNAENDVCTDNMVFDLFTLIQGEDDGGTWTELTNSGATLSGANNATLDATTATPGAGYQFAYIVPAQAPCQTNASITVTVNFNEVATADAGTDQTVCANATAQLNGTFGGGASMGMWSGGFGTFNDPSAPNAIYTPAPSEAGMMVTLTFTAIDPDGNGPCGDVSDDVVLMITDAVATVNAGIDETVCVDDEATVSGMIMTVGGDTPFGTWTITTGAGTLNDMGDGTASYRPVPVISPRT